MDINRLFIIIFLLMTNICFSQVSGIVVDNKTNQPLEGVAIILKPHNKWTITKKDGSFNINIEKFPITLEFSFLGKKKEFLTLEQSTDDLKIKLKTDDLKIDEVVVTAKTKKESTGSNIVIGKQAINLVQAQSLANVMQLMPGATFTETNLNHRQLLSIRSAYFNEKTQYNTFGDYLSTSNDQYYLNNTFGVSYVVDDVPLNNDVNLSGGKGLQYGIFSSIEDNSSVGRGVDLKNLSTNNIESIEVVQGISSARHGNHTSGLVKIIRAKGASPAKINTTLREGSYSIDFSKGFKLPKNKGFLNMSIDYLHSNKDPRFSISKFDRVTANTSWSFKKNGKIKNIFNASFGSNFNTYNIRETKFSSRKKRNDRKNFRFSNSNSLYFNNKFIDEFSTTFSINYSINKVFSAIFTSYGGKPIFGQYSEGTYQANYTPVAYWSSRIVENKPFTFFGRAEAYKILDFKNSTLNINTGVSLNVNKNFGKGDLNTSENISTSSGARTEGSTGYRNINFNDFLPTELRFSAYITAKINSYFFNKKWITDLGVRYDNYNSQATFSPRVNFALHFNKKIKTRFGFGLFSKAPSLQSLYPADIYYDFLIADYRTNNYSFALGHTFVRNYKTEGLKPSRALKYETGVDLNLKSANISLTAYCNKQYNGFTTIKNLEIANLPTFDFTFYPNKIPDYTLSGYRPVLLDYATPTNNLESKNYGIELLMATKKIKSINTSFSFSGSYRYTKNYQIKSIIDIIP